MRIGYIVHDLNDAAVLKRCAILRRGGAQVTLAGFHRGDAPATVDGNEALALGQTTDGDLGGRARSVLGLLTSSDDLAEHVSDCDMLIARNLECLALARRIAKGRPVIYECLDIHRSLLNTGIANRAIQIVEALLLDGVAAIITSSPAFIREYFARRPIGGAEVKLVENKILLEPGADPQDHPEPLPKPAGPPWVIGWFGMLRCQRTLEELGSLAKAAQCRVQVLIAGKPSPTELPDFEQRVADAAGVEFIGPYSVDDLPSLYARCHYAWAIDWFEEGQNSEWLLPNRLYEATANGTVPIVLARHEVARWLAAEGAGLRIENTKGLPDYFMQLDEQQYQSQRAALAAIPPRAIMADDAECRELVEWLRGHCAA